jgi:ankyrin repeat protein
MPRKRKNKMKHVRLRRGSKKKSNDMSMFMEMQFCINHYNTEERLYALLNRCSTQILQHRDITGDYLLHYACKNTGYKTLALLMLEKYPCASIYQIDWVDRDSLQIQIRMGIHIIVRTFLIGVAHLIENHVADFIEGYDGYRRETALFDACMNNKVDLVKLLLSHNLVDVNHQDTWGMTAFHYCCQIPNNELIMLFLENKNVDFEIEDTRNEYTAFDTYFALTSNPRCTNYVSCNQGILVEFAKKYSSIMKKCNVRRSNMIHEHVKHHWEDFSSFDYLLQNENAEKLINQKDRYGNTPFHYACCERAWSNTDHYKKLLLQPGLLLNAKNDKGRTPFHFACYKLNNDVIEDLISNSNVTENDIDNQGENGLHCMIQNFISGSIYGLALIDYYMTSVHVLLRKNPFLVTRRNNSSETPIDYVVKCLSICPGDKFVWINRRHRRLSLQRNKEFFEHLLKVLQDYHTEAKNCMYNYFIETLTNHIA